MNRFITYISPGEIGRMQAQERLLLAKNEMILFYLLHVIDCDKNLPLSCANKIANVAKFLFYMSPLGYFYDAKKAKLYYQLWLNF